MRATVKGIRIAGISSSVPQGKHSIVTTPEHLSQVEAEKISASIGVR